MKIAACSFWRQHSFHLVTNGTLVRPLLVPAEPRECSSFSLRCMATAARPSTPAPAPAAPPAKPAKQNTQQSVLLSKPEMALRVAMMKDDHELVKSLLNTVVSLKSYGHETLQLLLEHLLRKKDYLMTANYLKRYMDLPPKHKVPWKAFATIVEIYRLRPLLSRSKFPELLLHFYYERVDRSTGSVVRSYEELSDMHRAISLYADFVNDWLEVTPAHSKDMIKRRENLKKEIMVRVRRDLMALQRATTKVTQDETAKEQLRRSVPVVIDRRRDRRRFRPSYKELVYQALAELGKPSTSAEVAEYIIKRHPDLPHTNPNKVDVRANARVLLVNPRSFQSFEPADEKYRRKGKQYYFRSRNNHYNAITNPHLRPSLTLASLVDRPPVAATATRSDTLRSSQYIQRYSADILAQEVQRQAEEAAKNGPLTLRRRRASSPTEGDL